MSLLTDKQKAMILDWVDENLPAQPRGLRESGAVGSAKSFAVWRDGPGGDPGLHVILTNVKIPLSEAVLRHFARKDGLERLQEETMKAREKSTATAPAGFRSPAVKSSLLAQGMINWAEKNRLSMVWTSEGWMVRKGGKLLASGRSLGEALRNAAEKEKP